MKDRKFHTDKELKDNYPKPGVPADEAWAEMNKMLGAGVHPPPKPGKGPSVTEVKKIFWQYTLVTAVVTATIWGYYRKHTVVKTSDKTMVAVKNEIKQAKPFQNDTAKAPNNETGTPLDKSIAINDSVIKISLPAAGTGTQHTGNYTEKVNATVSYNDSAHAPLPKNKMNIPATREEDSVAIMYKNNAAKDNAINGEKNMQHNGPGRKGAGKSFGGATKNDHEGRNKTTTNLKNDAAAQHIRHPLNLSNHNRPASTNNKTMHSKNDAATQRKDHPLNLVNHNGPASINKYLLREINTPGHSLWAAILSFLKGPISTYPPKNIRVDSEHLKKFDNAINSLALSKKRGIKSKDKIKDTHKKSATGFDYGLQWDAAIPVQGTTNYSRGTNGNSKPYNIILPEVWLSKGFSNNSKMFLKINLNQQYFAGNKQVSLDSISPPDSSFHKKYLSKMSGFGAALEYSQRTHKNWTASIGISYSLTSSALLNRQRFNFYSGSFLGDSLYGIKRSSDDWKYISKSIVTGNFSLYYTFKKFDLGASVYVPLTNIPVYGNKNIRPVNAQLFLRWKLKKD